MLADHLIESHIRLTYGRLPVHLVTARLIRQWWRWVRPHWRRQTRSWRSCIINHMLMMPIQSSVMYTCWLGACLRHVHWNHYGLIRWDQRQVICIYLRLTFRINIIIHLPYRTSNILYINFHPILPSEPRTCTRTAGTWFWPCRPIFGCGIWIHTQV